MGLAGFGDGGRGTCCSAGGEGFAELASEVGREANVDGAPGDVPPWAGGARYLLTASRSGEVALGERMLVVGGLGTAVEDLVSVDVGCEFKVICDFESSPRAIAAAFHFAYLIRC